MRCKIVSHLGDEVNVKTKASSGILTLQDDAISISGSSTMTIPFSAVTNIEMFRLHGLGRMIKQVCNERTIFLKIVRFKFFRVFFIVNFFKTGMFYEALRQRQVEWVEQ